MTTKTTSRKPAVKAVAVKATAPVEAPVSAKPTAEALLKGVLALINRQSAKPIEDIKWGKAVALAGGGSVYINRGNADIRLTTGQAAALAKTIPGAKVRGPQGQYLRITF